MRFSFLLSFLLGSCVFAQQPVPEIITITPDTVVAVINGEKFTVGEFERITQGLNPQMRALAATRPEAYLEQYAQVRLLASEGEKAKLFEMSPYREKLRDARLQILAQAIVAEQNAKTPVTAEEVTKHFEANRKNYKEARVKVIYLSRLAQVSQVDGSKTTTTPVEEIKAKAEKVAMQAREGGNFIQLAKEYSDDRATAEKNADLPDPIRPTSINVPQNMRDAVLAAKPGDVVGPIEHQTGFYIFWVESINMPELAVVKNDVEKELRATKVQAWLAEMKSKASVKMENDAFWNTFKSANQQQPVPVQVTPAEPKPEAKKDAGTETPVVK